MIKPITAENGETPVLFHELNESPLGSLIEFELETINEDYYTMIYFRIPINPISNIMTTDRISPMNWFIRGGLENHLPDEGAARNSLGGAILLGIGDVNYD